MIAGVIQTMLPEGQVKCVLTAAKKRDLRVEFVSIPSGTDRWVLSCAIYVRPSSTSVVASISHTVAALDLRVPLAGLLPEYAGNPEPILELRVSHGHRVDDEVQESEAAYRGLLEESGKENHEGIYSTRYAFPQGDEKAHDLPRAPVTEHSLRYACVLCLSHVLG